MTEQRQIRSVARPASSSASSEMMTPKEIFSMLRRHLLLIFIMTIFGIGVGGTGWYLLRKYSPQYTAETYLRVLSPGLSDPMRIEDGSLNPQVEYGHRQTIVRYIKHKGNLSALLEKDVIKSTK
jgi:hypothetical protein